MRILQAHLAVREWLSIFPPPSAEIPTPRHAAKISHTHTQLTPSCCYVSTMGCMLVNLGQSVNNTNLFMLVCGNLILNNITSHQYKGAQQHYLLVCGSLCECECDDVDAIVMI